MAYDQGFKLLFILSCPWVYIMIILFFTQIEHFVPKYIQTRIINHFSNLLYKALLHHLTREGLLHPTLILRQCTKWQHYSTWFMFVFHFYSHWEHFEIRLRLGFFERIHKLGVMVDFAHWAKNVDLISCCCCWDHVLSM